MSGPAGEPRANMPTRTVTGAIAHITVKFHERSRPFDAYVSAMSEGQASVPRIPAITARVLVWISGTNLRDLLQKEVAFKVSAA